MDKGRKTKKKRLEIEKEKWLEIEKGRKKKKEGNTEK